MPRLLSTVASRKTWPLRFQIVLLVMSFAAANGCSKGKDPNRLPVFPVSGHLSIKGQTPTGAFVVLHPKAGTATNPKGEVVRPRAVVKPDGSFVFASYDADDGAPSGDYSLTVEWRKIVKSPDGSPVLGPNVIPPKYGRPEWSPVFIRVAEKSNELDPIKLNLTFGARIRESSGSELDAYTALTLRRSSESQLAGREITEAQR